MASVAGGGGEGFQLAEIGAGAGEEEKVAGHLAFSCHETSNDMDRTTFIV
jgi:hypothetical protein